MLAIQTETKISLITDLRLYQLNGRYVIQYNKSDIYASYENKEEAMNEFILLSNHLRNEKLKIVADKLEELSEVSENDRL